MEAFLSVGKYSNFQSDNFRYNSEYNDFLIHFEKKERQKEKITKIVFSDI